MPTHRFDGDWVTRSGSAANYFVMVTNEVPSRAAQSVLLHAARFHAAHTPSPHDLRLLELSHRDLLWKFLIEKKAKNQAYEFIMRAGLPMRSTSIAPAKSRITYLHLKNETALWKF